jgi:hypothetical protein
MTPEEIKSLAGGDTIINNNSGAIGVIVGHKLITLAGNDNVAYHENIHIQWIDGGCSIWGRDCHLWRDIRKVEVLTVEQANAATDWAQDMIKHCTSINEIEEVSNVEAVERDGKDEGLNPEQIAVAHSLLLNEYLHAIGRA